MKITRYDSPRQFAMNFLVAARSARERASPGVVSDQRIRRRIVDKMPTLIGLYGRGA